MIKNLFTLMALMLATGANAQTLLFSENFEQPSGADSVNLATGGSGYSNGWAISTTLSSEGTQSFHLQASASNQQHYFVSDPFSTVGRANVSLQFDHIAKLFPVNGGYLEISIDSGNSWMPISGTAYRGASPNFGQVGYFQSGSYGNWQSGNLNAIPTASWWKREVFDLNGLANDTASSPVSGYPHVLIRFKGDFNYLPSGGFAAGWWVDNIKVFGSSCELIPPQVDFAVAQDSCTSLSAGMINADSATVSIAAYDSLKYDSGLQTVAVYYSLNGGAFQSKNLSPGSPFFSSKLGLNPGDSIQYYLLATDSCGNNTRSPLLGHYDIYAPNIILPAKCTAGNCNLPGVISQLPWSESFEGSDWQAGYGQPNMGSLNLGQIADYYHRSSAYGSNNGWTVWDSATYSNSTGPLKAHNGLNYLYTDFYSSAGNSTYLFTTPCIDLTDTSESRQFSFYYHMFGSEISALRLDIDTGITSNQFHISYHEIVGQQQSQAGDSWQKATVDLSPFMGRVIRIRFRVSGSNTLWRNHIAIDQLELKRLFQQDLSVALHQPEVLTGLCGPANNLPLDIAISNVGRDSLASIPIAYQIDNNPVVRDTVTVVIAPHSQSIYTASASINLPASGSQTLKIWHEKAGDLNQSNDTASYELKPRQGSINLPYHYSFDDNPAGPLGGVTADGVWSNQSTLPNGIIVVNDSNSNNYPGGPSAANAGGSYLLNSTGSIIDTTRLVSQCISLPAASSATYELRLEYHYYGGNSNVSVWVHTNQDGWKKLNWTPSLLGQKAFNSLARFDLSAYAGKNIKLKVETNAPAGEFAIGQITIEETGDYDLALVGIADISLRNYENVSTLTNFGFSITSNQSLSANTQLHLELSNQCSGTVVATSSSYFSLSTTGPQENITGNFVLGTPLPAGIYKLKAWVNYTNDVYAGNDTITQTFYVRPFLTAPWFMDFESCYHPFVFNRGDFLQWEVGTPQQAPPHGGSRVAQTNLDAPAIRQGVERLISPTFIGLDTLVGVELRFRHKYDFNATGGGVLQYISPNGWTNLYDPTRPGHGQSKFKGNSNGWQMEQYRINSQQSLANFTFRFEATHGSWTVDDIELYVPPQFSVGPQGLIFSQVVPRQGLNAMELRISNSGQRAINELAVDIYDQNGTLLLDSTYQVSTLKAGNSRIIDLGELTLSATTTQLMVVTSRPHNRLDALPVDDTLYAQVSYLPVYDSSSLCLGFESNMELYPHNAISLARDTVWQYGTPAKVIFNSVHQGSKAWFTSQHSYPDLLNLYLYSPHFDIEALKCYRFSFWHQYDTEANFDGGNVEISLDSGKTWQVLGHTLDTAWYNTPHIQSLNLIDPGFSGQSNGWEHAVKEFKSFNDARIQFRFHFGSNYQQSGEGWLIDDVCLEEVQNACNQVGLEELSSPQPLVYPNPARDQIRIDLPENSGISLLEIRDQSGRVLLRRHLQNVTQQEISLEKLPAGSYLLQFVSKTNKIIHSQRLLIF